MTTQYTTILKLALPVQGELSGTWGDVVNDNITQMVEQAVAGKAVVNTWTGNSHTLTTADGTTSESRCAILELTDSGTALTGAGTVVCPTNTKLYIVDNNTAQIVTVKTSGGTGVAVPVGKTMLVYCDGTNVVEGVTHANSLSLGTSTVTADKILDEDNMASDSATAIATQQSIKAYVDSQVGTVDTLSEILANGNTTGANDIDVDSAQKVQFRDAAIYLNSSVDGQLDIVADGEVQIDTALVDINGNLDVSGTTNISGSVSFTKNAIAGVAISTTSRSSNTVTVTNSAVHGLTNGDLVNINGVANRSFNGYFTVAVSSTTVFTYSQTGADESSTGGTSTEVVYNINASGTGLNQMNGPLNIAANSGIDGLEITQSGSGEALSITGGNALFGDNDKAIFGIGNDLQIYHDGSHSYIKDAGTGQLRLLAGTNVQIWNADATSLAANFNGDTQTSLYYAGSSKLSTTASGIDVTGSVTLATTATDTGVDLTLNGNKSTNGGVGSIIFENAGDSVGMIRSSRASANDAADMLFYTQAAGGANTERLRIDSNGKILIGDSASHTSDLLQIETPASGGGHGIQIRRNDSNTDQNVGSITFGNNTATDLASISAKTDGATDNGALLFNTSVSGGANTERMRIDASGNVGIGTDSPSSYPVAPNLVVNAGTNGGITIKTGSTNYGGVYFADGTTGDEQYRGFIQYNHDYAGSTDSLLFGAAGTERMRIDASGNVIVGATTAQAADSVTLLPDGEVTAAGFYFSNNIGAAMNDTGIRRATTSTMVFDTASTERMRIEADGDVGIGTTGSVAFSAGSGLRIERAATATLRLQDTGAHGFEIRAAADAAEFFSANSKPFTFNGAASELMRIDASGNLLVGKTSANSALHGGEIRATGQVVAAVDGSWAGLFNRETDDGEILRFKKDDVTVGSIGTSIGSIYIGGNGDGGLFFNGSSDFRPWNKSTQANADGVTDLGASNARFKDLYLSGGVYLGGTGAANLLDDFEEGTWSPTMRTGTSAAWTNVFAENSYTKVGSLVTISISGTMTATGTTAISSLYLSSALPFAPRSFTPMLGYGQVIGSDGSGMKCVNTSLTYPVSADATIVPAKTVGQTVDYAVFLQYHTST